LYVVWGWCPISLFVCGNPFVQAPFLEDIILTWLNDLDALSKSNCESWASVAHTCDPSYSGGRDQEDLGLRPASGK
jgi:hypothetical protein